MTFRTLQATTHWLLQEKKIIIPAGAILFVFGAAPSHADWTNYPMANNFLYGTSSGATNSTAAAVASSLSASGAYGGGHTGSYSVRLHSFALYNAPWETGDNNYAGDHTHGGATASPNISQAYMSVGTVKANKDTSVIPSASSFICNPSTIPTGTSPIHGGSLTYPAYIRVGTTTGSTTVTNGTYTTSGNATSGSQYSSHRHHTTNGANLQFAYYPFNPVSETTGLTYNSTGIHSHSIAFQATGGRLGTTLHVQFWQAGVDTQAQSNIILGWDSAVSSTPPAPWYLCDGSNGTQNLNGYWIAATPSLGYHGTTGADSFNIVPGTSGDGAMSHSHNVVSSTGYQAQGGFLYGYHTSQSTFHSHSFSVGAGSVPAPARTYIRFIQYKG